MACIIALIDPSTNRAVKTVTVCTIYREAEEEATRLNEMLNKKPNKKERYWTVTTINI